MAWNTGSTKDLSSDSETSSKVLSVGAPIVYNPGSVGKAYKDGWNVERAYRDGVAKITWVFRAIDVIASNQARLPLQLRKGNSFDGEIVNSHPEVLDVLNSRSNVGESSYAFRKRLSSQLLMSTRGVFIEVMRNNLGKVSSLHLLPPEDTAPIPHKTRFVSGYEVELKNGKKKVLNPENVIWIKNPHPLDPYRSVTPLEAAGVAIEIEQLAKLYNRNFLLNDGRPGGLIVLRGEIEPEDRDELESRFRGGPRRAGSVSVISSDDGADFVDTGSSPRDMAYQQMRAITKEEILAAFGVPESVIGNASGRTFSNAAEEGRVFWQETMSPHLTMIATALDALVDKLYISFNTQQVPILILSKQEREQYLLQEFGSALITANEYRTLTGRDKVESELADSLLANPSLTSIGNTEKPLVLPDPNVAQNPEGLPEGGQQPNPQGQVPLDVLKGDVPILDSSQDPTIFGDVDPNNLRDVSSATKSDKLPVKDEKRRLEIENPDFEHKTVWEYDQKAEASVNKWSEMMEEKLANFFNRQQRVVMEKARSKRVSDALRDGTLSSEMLFDKTVWDRQIDEDLRPIIVGAYQDAAKNSEAASDEVDQTEAKKLSDEQIERAQKMNDTTESQIAAAVFTALNLDGSLDEQKKFLYLAVGAIYVDAGTDRKATIAEHEAFTAYNGGTYLAAKTAGEIDKTWLTKLDDRVRKTHRLLHGKTVGFSDTFEGGLRFPGDPLASPQQTINCRCLLTFSLRR